MIIHEALSEAIIGAAIEVHRHVGPGLVESAYAQLLRHELTLRGIAFISEIDVPVKYKGVLLDCGYRADLIVDDKIIVEIKAVEKIIPVHEAQLITYLKLTGKRVGLLINFNVPVLKDGILRRVI